MFPVRLYYIDVMIFIHDMIITLIDLLIASLFIDVTKLIAANFSQTPTRQIYSENDKS